MGAGLLMARVGQQVRLSALSLEGRLAVAEQESVIFPTDVPVAPAVAQRPEAYMAALWARVTRAHPGRWVTVYASARLASDEALREHVQIVLTDRSDQTRGQTRAVRADQTWTTADLHAKDALIRAGLGWGNMPHHLVADALRTGALVRLSPRAWERQRWSPTANPTNATPGPGPRAPGPRPAFPAPKHYKPVTTSITRPALPYAPPRTPCDQRFCDANSDGTKVDERGRKEDA